MGKQQAINALTGLIALLEPRRLKIRGLLGISSADSTAAVTGRPNYVYFREAGDPSRISQIYNNKVPPLPDLPVIAGLDAVNPDTVQVLDIDIGALASWSNQPYLPQHHETHELGSTDTDGNRVDSDVVYLQKQQLVPFSVQPTYPVSMQLDIQADFYETETGRKFYVGGTTKAFSAATTPGYAVVELIYVDANNCLNYERGSEYVDTESISLSNIPETPAGGVAMGAVYLPYGTTEIDYDNLLDVRILFRTAAAFQHTHSSPEDGGLLTAGLCITGNVRFIRESDQATLAYFHSDLNARFDLLSDVSITGNVGITGDMNVSGNEANFYDTEVNMLGTSRLRIPTGTGVSGWSGQTGDIAYDTGFDILYVYNGGWHAT